MARARKIQVLGFARLQAVLMALLGLVEAVLYNLFARWFGGVEVDFVQ
jgi:ubiquinone biosynthesis protein UbiJ